MISLILLMVPSNGPLENGNLKVLLILGRCFFSVLIDVFIGSEINSLLNNSRSEKASKSLFLLQYNKF